MVEAASSKVFSTSFVTYSLYKKGKPTLAFFVVFYVALCPFYRTRGGQFKSCRHGTAPDFSQHHCTFCLACCNFCVGCLHAVLPHFPAHGWVVLCSTRLCWPCPNVPQANGNKSPPFACKTRQFAHHVVAKTHKKRPCRVAKPCFVLHLLL